MTPSGRHKIVVLLASGWTVLGAPGCANRGGGEEAEEEPHYDPVPVHVARVETTTLEPTLGLVGTVIAVPEQTAVIGAQVAGTIDQVLVVAGQSVRAGDPLVLLDARLTRADEARAQAVVNEQKAVLARLESGPRPQEIDAARQAMEKARAEADALAAKLQALKPLLEKEEISRVQFDVAQAELQAAESEHSAAAARLALLEAGTRQEDIAEARARLENAQAVLSRAQLDVGFCRITSPIDGTVTEVIGRRGMTIDRNAVVASVVDESTLFVRFRVPSASLLDVVPGAPVHVQLTNLADRSFAGAVTRLAPEADPDTGDVEAFATVRNDAGVLRPGLGCRITVDLPRVPNALVIPAVALADRGGTPVVTVVRNDRAREVEIDAGPEIGGRIQVLGGLAPGDVVVTENGYGLPDDCPVTIVSD